MIKVVFFDVANTLLRKPELFDKMKVVLQEEGFDISIDDLQKRHSLLSEVIDFPDKTSPEFYKDFNSKFLMQFGIIPTDKLLSNIFEACAYLPWSPFPDTAILNDIEYPMGVISNWDHTLSSKLAEHFDHKFDWIFGSADLKCRKPSIEFYKFIPNSTGLQPSEILYVGDSLKLDIKPALSLGIKAVLVDRLNIYSHSKIDRVISLDALKKYF